VTHEIGLAAYSEYLTLREPARILTARELLGQGVSEVCNGASLALRLGLSHFV
jgi:hypothetical protein